MRSVNMRQLRDTRRLKAWLRAGRTVELKERNEAIADIVPRRKPEAPAKWPDFAARRKKIFGERVLTVVADLINDRGRF